MPNNSDDESGRQVRFFEHNMQDKNVHSTLHIGAVLCSQRLHAIAKYLGFIYAGI